MKVKLRVFEVCFDAPVRADVFQVAAEHVVYDEIVVPGVVFVEMAMEAARAELGPEAQLRDVQMVWPFVVPKDGDSDGKQMTMRLAIINRKRFELRSQGAGDEQWTTHCEGTLEVSGGGARAAEEMDPRLSLTACAERCPEVVDPKKLPLDATWKRPCHAFELAVEHLKRAIVKVSPGRQHGPLVGPQVPGVPRLPPQPR